MFIEPQIGKSVVDSRIYRGWIEVICGSMFSGKTEELIRRINRAVIARQSVEIFKPSIDKRYHDEDVVSHDQRLIRSTPVNFASDILLLTGSTDVVGIDEAQFFDMELVSVCDTLANHGKRVVVAGLDMDYLGKPFGPIPPLMAIAEYVTKVHAICVKCGAIASYSYRYSRTGSQIMVGEKNVYEARCRKCFNEAMRETNH